MPEASRERGAVLAIARHPGGRERRRHIPALLRHLLVASFGSAVAAVAAIIVRAMGF